jgi:hypothetical protein
MIAKSIVGYEAAQGNVEKLGQLQQTLSAAGLESIFEAVQGLSAEERRTEMAAGMAKVERVTFEALTRKIEGDQKAGSKLATKGSASGTADLFTQNVANYIGLSTRILSAVLEGDKALATKVRTEAAEMANAGGLVKPGG